jgi:hypothetical protein
MTQMEQSPFEWKTPKSSNNVLKVAYVSQGPFQCHLTVRPDYDHDWLLGRGTFSETWEEGALEVPGWASGSHTYRYFLPETGLTSEQARFAMSVCCDPDAAGYYAVEVEAIVTVLDVELAAEHLYGIETSIAEDDSFLDEVAQLKLAEALESAQAKLKALQSLPGRSAHQDRKGEQ